jgi:hypothetical protein
VTPERKAELRRNWGFCSSVAEWSRVAECLDALDAVEAELADDRAALEESDREVQAKLAQQQVEIARLHAVLTQAEETLHALYSLELTNDGQENFKNGITMSMIDAIRALRESK